MQFEIAFGMQFLFYFCFFFRVEKIKIDLKIKKAIKNNICKICLDIISIVICMFFFWEWITSFAMVQQIHRHALCFLFLQIYGFLWQLMYILQLSNFISRCIRMLVHKIMFAAHVITSIQSEFCFNLPLQIVCWFLCTVEHSRKKMETFFLFCNHVLSTTN